MDLHLSIKEIFTAFMVLFAVIDITGSTPIIINLNGNRKTGAGRESCSDLLCSHDYFPFCRGCPVATFQCRHFFFRHSRSIGIAGACCRNVFSVEIFRNDGPAGSVTIVPVVFPLIAGAGTLTTTLSLRAECHLSNLILAISLNMLLVYLVLRNAYLVERILGKSGVYVLRKFFGIILLAMSVRLFISNLSMLLNSFSR